MPSVLEMQSEEVNQAEDHDCGDDGHLNSFVLAARLLKKKKNFYKFERERAGEGKPERERRIPIGLHAVSAEPDAGLEPTDREIMT